jgi:hypothetical protein
VKDLLGLITTIVVAEPRPGVRDRGYESSTCFGSEDEVETGFVKEAEDFMLHELPPL